MKKQAGFTLIELVVVITILGILAAVAVPRFISMQSNARAASLQGALGAMKSAANMAHAAWLAGGGTGATVNMEGATINITNGYPAATDIANAAQMSSGDYTVTQSSGTATVTVPSAATPASCQITYTEAASGASPTYGSTLTGC